MFFARRPIPPSSSTSTPPSRPKGLWKAKSRVIGEKQKQPPKQSSLSLGLSPRPSSPRSSRSSSSSTLLSSSEDEGELLFDDSASTSSTSSISRKRRRVDRSFHSDDSGSEDEMEDQVYLWDYSSCRSPTPLEIKKTQVSITLPSNSFQGSSTSLASRSRPTPRKQIQSSIGLPAETQDGDEEVAWADWEEIHKMLTAVEEGSEPTSLPNLRTVIHECQRVLRLYPEPSQLFQYYAHPVPPTVVHTVLGHALFLFGDILNRHSSNSILLDNEPTAPTAYWLAALDVFTMGDNLPRQTDDDAQSDWRMDLIWGRTLVALVRALQCSNSSSQQTPKAHPDSPLGYIELNHPPHVTRETETTELLKLAMDQVTRGYFHMPRSSPSTHTIASSSSSTIASPSSPCTSACTCLSAIANDVLHIAPCLSRANDRVYWLRWGESLFASASPSTYVTPVSSLSSASSMSSIHPSSVTAVSRGQCNLLLARALVEVGDEEEEWREEAREALDNALEFLEQAPCSTIRHGSPNLKRKWDQVEVDGEPMAADDGDVEQMIKEARDMLVRLG
ncbi:hypothetical protein AAF712_013385 [Marasmius tenuissimus]|uniref:Uncharacterized protein n=1 Tax=Marasmius tenuissimus TaxID=585030 RepID=A0ABR2ZHA6_9AGAR|nr:hypothetical protein PM082_011474 [Marasmius tenuissimus]